MAELTDYVRRAVEIVAGRLGKRAVYVRACFDDKDEADRKLYARFIIRLFVEETARRMELEASAIKVIEWNRTEAEHKYGDADVAEGWACVRELRAALGAK